MIKISFEIPLSCEVINIPLCLPPVQEIFTYCIWSTVKKWRNIFVRLTYFCWSWFHLSLWFLISTWLWFFFWVALAFSSTAKKHIILVNIRGTDWLIVQRKLEELIVYRIVNRLTSVKHLRNTHESFMHESVNLVQRSY